MSKTWITLFLCFPLNSGHDTDGDEMIDGLELYKAIHHAKVHKDSHEHKLPDQAPPPGVPQLHYDPALEAFIEGTEDLGAVGKLCLERSLCRDWITTYAHIYVDYTFFIFVGFVDQLLSNYDKDEDGRLNFVEFFSSYEEAKDTLKIS